MTVIKKGKKDIMISCVPNPPLPKTPEEEEAEGAVSTSPPI